nr:hypothetical protein [Actinomarinicola tropica]
MLNTSRVRQTSRREVAFGDECMHGQQFDGGDVQRPQVVEDHGAGQAGVGAALLNGYVRVARGEPADVGFVDERVVPGRVGRVIVAPVESAVDDDALGDERRAVDVVGVGERVVPDQLAVEGAGVGVDEQLGRVVPFAATRVMRAPRPQPVALAVPDTGKVGVPPRTGALGELDTLLPVVVIEQA